MRWAAGAERATAHAFLNFDKHCQIASTIALLDGKPMTLAGDIRSSAAMSATVVWRTPTAEKGSAVSMIRARVSSGLF
jgi:hypothetical protein